MQAKIVYLKLPMLFSRAEAFVTIISPKFEFDVFDTRTVQEIL